MRLRAGFTLLELVVAVAIVGILLTLAVPSFREAMMNVRISAQANDLLADLALARSEAAKRNQGVFLCASNDQSTCNSTAWRDGWIVFADANGDNQWDAGDVLLKTRPAAEGSSTIVSRNHASTGGSVYMPYRPTGITGRGEIDFVVCDNRTTPNSGRRVNISALGRPQVTRVTCPFAL